MPKAIFTGDDVDRFELLKPGDYAFEVIGYEAGLSNSGKTSGCEIVTLKLKLFSDATFSKPVAVLSDRLTFPGTGGRDLDRFLNAQLNMFAKCTGLAGAVGEAIEYSEAACVGLRGWLRVKQVKSEKTGNMMNRIDFFRTDKGQIAKVVQMAAPAGEEEAWNV